MSVPLVSLLIALGVTAPVAYAVDEFATPRPSVKTQPVVKAQSVVKTQAVFKTQPDLKTQPNVKTQPDVVGTHVPEVQVLRAPNVVGQPVGSARVILDRAHLRVGRETPQLTPEHPAGVVLGQDPKPGTVMQPGASVSLWVATPPRTPGTSDGPAGPPQQTQVIVPNLIGRSAESAAAVLGKPGLRLGDRRRQESDAVAGTVIAQLPTAGTPVRPGTSVDVTIAVPTTVVVPDLSGQTPREAARLLHRYQLALGQERGHESSAPQGTVIRQSPAAGTRVPRETPVNVLIATAPVPVPPPVSWTPPVPPRPPIVVVPPIVIAPPVPPVATVPPLPPAPPVETPLPPAPPVVTAPPAPPAPIAPVPAAPPAVAVAAPAPAPVRKPTPTPVPPAPPVQPTPEVRPAPPEPQPLRESGKARWPRPVALGLGSMLLFGAASIVYYRSRMTNLTQPPLAVPTLTFAAHWDMGTQQIEATAPLSRGTGLRLVSGVETATTTLDTDHLVGMAHGMGGTR